MFAYHVNTKFQNSIKQKVDKRVKQIFLHDVTVCFYEKNPHIVFCKDYSINKCMEGLVGILCSPTTHTYF